MTIEEYTDPNLFPLTTQPGLSLDNQMILDACNYDEFEKDRRNRVPMDEHQRAVGRELEAKHAGRGNILRQLQSGRGAQNGGYDPNVRPGVPPMGTPLPQPLGGVGGNPQTAGGAPLMAERGQTPVRYSTDLARLLEAAMRNPTDPMVHGLIADALDEAHPGGAVAELIRRQWGHGVYGGTGGNRGQNTWFPPFAGFDQTLPHAPLGTEGPFELRLQHAQDTSGDTPVGSRWVIHATPMPSGAYGPGYHFEFPHDRAHEIPRMFPAALDFIDPWEMTGSPEAQELVHRDTVRAFNLRMEEQERNRGG